MFVKNNSVAAVKEYLREKLREKFAVNEITTISKLVITERLQLENSQYLLANDLKTSESDLLFFRSVVKRLLVDEPLQYIIGKTTFYDLEIKCAPGALIPRPETEELVEWIIQENKDALEIHDFCTGTGCIPLALKSELKDCNVKASDFSDSCLKLATENATDLALNVEFMKIDVFSSSVSQIADRSLDVISANPPYIPFSDKTKMEANVLNFEPAEALFVDNSDPLIFYRRIAEIAKMKLKKGGKVYFEIHEDFGQECRELLEILTFINIELRKDLQGKDRMIRAEI